MSEPQYEGGPAFPVLTPMHYGMTLRDWFAGQALAGGAEHVTPDDRSASAWAKDAYRIADAMLAEEKQDAMNNSHVPEPFRSILNDVREATQTLANCAAKGKLQPDGTRRPEQHHNEAITMPEPMKIIIEHSPYPNTEPQYRWTAYYEGREDELSKAGMTPDQALERFLIAASNRDEPEID